MDAIIEYLLKVDGGKVIALLGLWMWWDLRGVVKGMASSLATLTIQLATIVERVDSHEKRLDRIEDKKG